MKCFLQPLYASGRPTKPVVINYCEDSNEGKKEKMEEVEGCFVSMKGYLSILKTQRKKSYRKVLLNDQLSLIED